MREKSEDVASVKVCDESENVFDVDGARMEKELRESTRKLKVWTKLRNGLFGWRVRAQPKRSAKPTLHAKTSQISSPSVGLFKWVLAGDKNLTLEKDKFETKKGVGKRRLSLGGDRARAENEMESEGTKKLRWDDILD